MNIVNSLMNNQIDFYDISKVDLYVKAYERWILPKCGLVYIGQKRNIWLWDFEKNEKIGQFSFDEVKEKIDAKFFVDEVIDKKYYPEWIDENYKIKVEFNGNELIIWYWNNSVSFSIEDLDLKPLKSVAPNYMIEPNVTLK